MGGCGRGLIPERGGSEEEGRRGVGSHWEERGKVKEEGKKERRGKEEEGDARRQRRKEEGTERLSLRKLWGEFASEPRDPESHDIAADQC